jgi:putative ABC transport system permease protein
MCRLRLVLFASLRDLQWRLRRFLIGVIAAGLVFALALLISGVSASFHTEITRVVDSFDVDAWIVPAGVSGPFTSANVFPETEVAKVAAMPGVRAAEPIALFRTVVQENGIHDLNLIGIQPGGIADPKLRDGHGLQKSGDLIVDDSLPIKLGTKVDISRRTFTVVGRTKGLTYFAGTPVAFISLPDLQANNLSGAKLATAVVVRGSGHAAPPGFHSLTNAEVMKDLRRPLEKPSQTIDFLRVLLWIVAAGIIGSVLYLQAIERSRDFAVFKATGVTAGTLLAGLVLQAVLLALSAAVAALFLSIVLKPAMSMSVEIPPSAYVSLPIIAVFVGLLSSLVALRRALSVDPALAFGG